VRRRLIDLRNLGAGNHKIFREIEGIQAWCRGSLCIVKTLGITRKDVKSGRLTWNL